MWRSFFIFRKDAVMIVQEEVEYSTECSEGVQSHLRDERKMQRRSPREMKCHPRSECMRVIP